MKKFPLLLACLLVPVFVNAATFSLTDTRGYTHTPEKYRDKWVLINLWATWCSPCLTEMPELEAVHKARSDIVVLGLAVDGQNPRRIMQFAEKLGVTFPIIAGNMELARQFNPIGFPTTIIYAPSGKQVLFKTGQITHKEIEALLHP